MKAALRGWIAEVDADHPDRPLAQADYVAWRNRMVRSPKADGVRLPTVPTLMKYLGGWGAVLAELGELDRHPDVVAARRRLDSSPQAGWAIAAVRSLELESAPAPAADEGFEHAAGWLRWMTAPLSAKERTGLEMHRWDLLRAALIVRLAGLGRHLEIPSAEGIKSRADDRSWPTAKLRAGIVDPACGNCSPTTRSFDDEELIDALAAAARALGRPPTRGEYEAYRQQEARAGGPRLPSEATIRMRLGSGNSWASVLQRLATERSELSPEGGTG